MVEERGYNAFTVSAGEPSFQHAALKRYPFELRKEHCAPISTCCHHPCTIYIYNKTQSIPKAITAGASNFEKMKAGEPFKIRLVD